MSDYDNPTPPQPEPQPIPLSGPKTAPAPKPLPREEPTPRTIFPVVLAVAFAGVLAGSWVVQGQGSTSTPAAASAPATPAADPATAEPAAPVPTPTAPSTATVDDVKGLKAEIDALAKKIDEMPKPEPAPDLKPIREKIDALSKAVEPAAEAPKKIEDLAGRLAEADKAVATLKDEIASIKAATTARPAATAATDTAGAAKPAETMAAMTSAVDLFKGGKYAEALDAFKKLPADDARVLYYSALANGLTTKEWKGETERLALQAVDREKAGSPKAAEIDAAFAGLTDLQGKAWLNYYRQRAR